MLNPKFNYKKINRETLDGRRYYVTPTGERVPSVTTILDRTKPAEARQALAEWRKRVGEDRAQQITTEAANRGTRMHKWLENYVQTGDAGTPGTHPESQRSHRMAMKIIESGFANVSEVWGNEVPLYFPELYAGTTDCVGVHGGEEAILDFKQSNKPKRREWIDDYFLQLTAYALAHNEVHGTSIRKGVVMMSVRPEQDAEPEYQEFVLEPKDFDMWTQRWCDRVSEYYRIR
jgi:genome maintenance exonuclease 1